MIVEITDIKVLRHAPVKCRYCEKESELGCCSSSHLYCPNCGCPQTKPLNEVTNGKG